MFSLIKYIFLSIMAIYLMSGTEETAGQVILNPQILMDLKKAAKENCWISFDDSIILQSGKQAEDDAKKESNYNNKYPDWDENAVLPDDNCHHAKFLKNLLNVTTVEDAAELHGCFISGVKNALKSSTTGALADSAKFAEEKIVGLKGDEALCTFYNYHGYSFYHKINEVIKKCIGDNTNSTQVYPFQ